MKRLFVYSATLLVFSACKSNWSAAEKDKFKATCNSGFATTLGTAKAKEFCDCFQEKVEKKYATKAEADKATQAELGGLIVDCPK